MKKKYFVELYFNKEGKQELGFSDTPELDHYKTETIMEQMISTSWEEAKRNLLLKYPNIAYIHVHETRNIDI